MMSIKELHAGDGYAYLLRGVADGEGITGVVSPMSRYYAESGHPPGRWMGTGLAGLADGDGLAAGARVGEEQMERLFKHGTDPVTGAPLGRRYAQPRSWRERADARIRRLPGSLTPDEHAARVVAIEAEERSRPTRRAVAGFDCVFSPPKSVSTLWALADHAVREQVANAHYDAVAEVMRVMERDVARTRIGTDGVAQVETRGQIATAFDHYDSRAGDPQLHTHVVLANRVQGPDGGWRTLDSRGSLFPAAVAMSELYDTLLADRLTAELGVGWERRGTPAKPKNQSWEIAGVPDALIAEFSQRAKGIETVKDELIAAYRERHGREPDDVTIVRLRQQATYATRPDKEFRSLAEMSADWRARAAAILDDDPHHWAASVTNRAGRAKSTLRFADVAPLIDQLAAQAFNELANERSTWRTWNVRAVAARASMPYRLATPDDRDALIDAVTRRVAQMSVCITPPALASTPEVFRRADGTSAFRRSHAEVYTSVDVLAAEDRLLAAAGTRTIPVIAPDLIKANLQAPTDQGVVVGTDQAAVVRQLAESGRLLDLLVGPAGSGKTTALATLRSAWEAAHGPGSVVGLAPSAAAAEVLGASLGIATENTAKWLHESIGPGATHRRERASKLQARRKAAKPGVSTPHIAAAMRQLEAEYDRWSFRPGQLVIIDEASLAGTLALDALRDQAQRAGAKLLLVGDWAQLSAVDAGGAFGMLVRERGEYVPELTNVRRFSNEWERQASTRLRAGDPDVIDTYISHGRIHGGDSEQVVEDAYHAWRADEAAGRRSLLIAADANMVRTLNERARADRATHALVEPGGVMLHDGTHAGLGDRIVTRHNDRTLAAGPRTWVKNGDQWIVRDRHNDGALTVANANGHARLTLPASYVAEHVELAYATTAHRAQGTTVDTTHAIVEADRTTREVLYVAMTRGRHTNTAHVVTELATEEIPDNETRTTRDVLTEVIHRSGAELSARETIAQEQQQATSIARLAAEYETLAREAATDHWAGLIRSHAWPQERGDPSTSGSFPALVTAMRQAEATGLKLDQLLPKLATNEELEHAENPVSVIHRRLEQVTAAAPEPPTSPTGRRTIAGLIPAAAHVSDPEMQCALEERAALIEQRANTLAREAITHQAPWLADLGTAPHDPAKHAQWMHSVATVAAYRDRHDVVGRTALGDGAAPGIQQGSDQRRAKAAIERARHAPDRVAPPDPRTHARPTTIQHIRTM